MVEYIFVSFYTNCAEKNHHTLCFLLSVAVLCPPQRHRMISNNIMIAFVSVRFVWCTHALCLSWCSLNSRSFFSRFFLVVWKYEVNLYPCHPNGSLSLYFFFSSSMHVWFFNFSRHEYIRTNLCICSLCFGYVNWKFMQKDTRTQFGSSVLSLSLCHTLSLSFFSSSNSLMTLCKYAHRLHLIPSYVTLLCAWLYCLRSLFSFWVHNTTSAYYLFLYTHKHPHTWIISHSTAQHKLQFQFRFQIYPGSLVPVMLIVCICVD